MQALGGPLGPILQLSLRAQRTRRLDEELERCARVGDNAEIRAEHATDLGRLDIDVNEFAAFV